MLNVRLSIVVVYYTMKKELQQLLEDGLSSYEIAELLGIPRSTIQSRIQKLGLKSTKQSFGETATVHKCGRCGCIDSAKFYGHKKYICVDCFNKETRERMRNNKRNAVALLGGCCSICGYNKSIMALEFHHTIPTNKDVNFASMTHWSWSRIEKELKTCVLLCANCHREVHEELRNNTNMES